MFQLQTFGTKDNHYTGDYAMGGVKPKVGPKKMRKGGAAKKRKLPLVNVKPPEDTIASSGRPSRRRKVASHQKGLAQLPKEVRNRMGYMRSGGAVKKMAKGGAAVRSSCPSKGL